MHISKYFLASLLLSGCSVMPHTGPSAGGMANSNAVNVIDVTPVLATGMQSEVAKQEQVQVNAALASLAGRGDDSPLTLEAGDKISITLWSFSPWSTGAANALTQASGPSPSALGNYQIAADGTVSLPYIGTVSLVGLDVSAAQSRLAALYVHAGIVRDPSVIIVPRDIPQGSILVTGSIGAPKLIPWTPAGITLADALTQGLGDGTEVLGSESDFAMSKTALQVDIVRGGRTVQLPINEALQQTVGLQPNDKVIIKKAANVKVVLLGGGVSKNGVEGYGESPTLAQVLAAASGLNADTANDHAVFVLREVPGQPKPALYDFAWNKVSGLVAAQSFPMLNGDVVYVAEAPIVPIERVVSILFELAVPIQAAK